MKSKRALMYVAIAVVALTFSLAVSAQAQTLKVIHTFTGKGDGATPNGSLIFDAAGNLYGVTAAGGTSTSCPGGCGVAFKLSPATSGGWKETPLFSFNLSAGTAPTGNLLLNSTGNLVGVAPGSYSSGLVFDLSPTAKGSWQESVVYAFSGPGDGDYAEDGFVSDGSGNLYGVASLGGNTADCSSNGCGTVFELSPTSSGFWHETTLYTFSGGADGANPLARLVFDSAGNLYGTTSYGGNLGNACPALGCGVVFQLSRNSSGTWTQTVIHSFTGADGAGPLASLAMDAAGNLYGTTFWGGTHCPSAGCGVVFELTPSSSGRWQETVLHNFTGNADGSSPSSGLTLDSSGALYGTTATGGLGNDCGGNGCGVIFKLAPTGTGAWTFTRLHAFTGGVDGAEISTSFRNMPLIFGADGNLYGAAPTGGAHSAGVVFQIAP